MQTTRDFVPPPHHQPRSRRGGRRPGAGARPGNLNALKHGRYSRFKDVLPPEPFDPAVVARAVLVQQRTEAERIAAAFFKVVLESRWQRDAADAVAAGRPVPPPPLLRPSRKDHARVIDFLRASDTLARLERHGAEGRPARDPAAVADLRRRAQQLDDALPVIALLLDRAACPAETPHSLAAVLRNEVGLDQSAAIPVESTARALAALTESAQPQTRKTTPSNPTTADTLLTLRHQLAAFAQEASVSQHAPPLPPATAPSRPAPHCRSARQSPRPAPPRRTRPSTAT